MLRIRVATEDSPRHGMFMIMTDTQLGLRSITENVCLM
jgi:hypothetical protein